MASRFDLVALLRRLAPVLEATFLRYGITPDEAAVVLDEAVLEVQLRASRSCDCEGRLLRAVERGCEAAVRTSCRTMKREEPVIETETENDDDARRK
jgi:hypothetical protein